MSIILLFLALVVLALLSVISFIVCAIRKKPLKRSSIVFLTSVLLCVALVCVTQITAFTPALSGGNAIAELRELTLNGRREWISIRGKDKTKPILLFLAGGPGGSQMAAVRHDLAALEDHFVVVNWDQPGSGKSYGAMNIRDITPDVYIEDGIALTQYLCEEFGQEKIHLVGESWGSALGIFLADAAPELYHGFIGTGQMVAFLETERIDYALALQIAREKGDAATVNTLEANGEPPYYGDDVTWKSAPYLQYLSGVMVSNPEIHNGGYNTLRDIFSSEYGILDSINYFRGIVDTFNHVYPQLYDIDLRESFAELEVPVYFFLGRHDVNAPTALVEDYCAKLAAPKKEIVWFEHSGHSPWINESALFVSEVLRVTENI